MLDHDETPEPDAPTDPWSSFLPGQELVPAYLTSRYAAQYRVIVDVLLAEQDTSLTGLSYDEVAAGVRVALAGRVPADVVARLWGGEVLNLDARLDRLVHWQVVTRWQEAARTGEDFLRRRDRYQLTPQAANLHAFWSSANDAEEAAGDLTLAPRAIHQRLVAFADAVRSASYTAAATEYQQVGSIHLAMATSARGWQRTLAHALSGSPDPAKQDQLWQTLRAYIGMWGEQVDIHSPRIAELVAVLDPVLTPDVWRACVRASTDTDVGDEAVAVQVRRWRHTWDALGSWFSGDQGQARRLRRQLRDLVGRWARNMNLLLDTGGAVTRRADLLALAETIERAPDDITAWRTWDTAVGTFSARHLLLVPDAADDLSLSWAEAPPVPVTARYREQGPRAAVGRRPKVPDYSTGKAAARRARAAAEAARTGAEAALRRRSATYLADWDHVTDAELDLLLELVGAAVRERSRTAVTSDGRWRVSLTEPPRDPPTATLHADAGSLVTLNWHFRLDPYER